MAITADQARNVARVFLDVSHALGQYRFDNWAALGADDRKALEDTEWDLSNFSGSITTAAVGIALDSVGSSIDDVMNATNQAKDAVKKIQQVKSLITVMADVVALGGAFVSKNPAAVAAATGNLAKAVKDAVK